jgi:hypothetical protein
VIKLRRAFALWFAVAGMTVVVVPPASAAPPAAFPGLKDSAAINGPAVIAGEVRNKRGMRIAADLTLLAMPTWETYSAMTVGSEARILPVGRATVDASGQYELRLDPSVPVAAFTSTTGTLNLLILARGANARSWYHFSTRLPAAASAGAPESSLAAQGNASERQDLTLDPTPADQELPEAVPQPLMKFGACGEVKQSVLGTYWDSLAELYAKSHAKVDFQYATEATSMLGYATSVSGTNGSWKSGGQLEAKSTNTIDFAAVGPNQLQVKRTKFELAKYLQYCTFPDGIFTSWYAIHASRWIGGSSSYNIAGYPTASYCTPYGNGDVVTIDQHNAVTWTNGFSVSAVPGLGFDLSTKTGFTVKAKQKWTFIAVGGSLCGTNDYPFSAVTIVGK